MRRWIATSLAIIIVLIVGVGALGAQSTDNYSLSADDSVEIPTQEVDYEDTVFEINRVAETNPDSYVTVTATAPQERNYVVYVVDKQERVRQSNTGTGTEEIPLDLTGLDPGTYAVTIDKNGTVAAMPLVIEAYDLSLEVPDETTRNTETTVSISLETIDDSTDLEQVVVSLWDGSEELTVTATRSAEQQYTATIPANELSVGTYTVVARAETATTAFGQNELVGISETATISVTAGTTSTATRTKTESTEDETRSDDSQEPSGTDAATVVTTTTSTTPSVTQTSTTTPAVTETSTPLPTLSSVTQTSTPTPEQTTTVTATVRTTQTSVPRATTSPGQTTTSNTTPLQTGTTTTMSPSVSEATASTGTTTMRTTAQSESRQETTSTVGGSFEKFVYVLITAIISGQALRRRTA